MQRARAVASHPHAHARGVTYPRKRAPQSYPAHTPTHTRGESRDQRTCAWDISSLSPPRLARRILQRDFASTLICSLSHSHAYARKITPDSFSTFPGSSIPTQGAGNDARNRISMSRRQFFHPHAYARGTTRRTRLSAPALAISHPHAYARGTTSFRVEAAKTPEPLTPPRIRAGNDGDDLLSARQERTHTPTPTRGERLRALSPPGFPPAHTPTPTRGERLSLSQSLSDKDPPSPVREPNFLTRREHIQEKIQSCNLPELSGITLSANLPGNGCAPEVRGSACPVGTGEAIPSIAASRTRMPYSGRSP